MDECLLDPGTAEAMVAGHHPQSMTVDIVEEDQDDIETETPGVEVLKLQHQEIHQEATQEHNY